MEKLIPTINKVRDVLSTLGESMIDLPQLVVVGSQSAGKSSVLEHIVGRDFLPRGNDIVTRRPLVLELYNIPSGSNEESTEWAEFSHIHDRTFTDFDEIRKEIENETNKVAGTNKGVSQKPIELKIYSSKVLNLTLVDLPGITKNPVGDQPKDIEKMIKRIILDYIQKPNSIILAVTPANIDIANSEALKLAREVDPKGDRTIGILTKIDLMDQGTDALDILNGKVIPLRLGYIPVINRSQRDIVEKKRIAYALKAEEEFFANSPIYGSISYRCGTPYLARTLNSILVQHIRDKLPALRRKIEEVVKKTQSDLESYGGLYATFGGKGPTLLHLLNQYSAGFVDAIDGNSSDVSTEELRGGASIYLVFNENFQNKLNSIDPCRDFSTMQIRTAIRNSSGIRPSLFVSEKSFENLAKKGLERFYDPSLNCVEMVYHELLRVVDKTGGLELSRYPVLQTQIREAVKKILHERLSPTNQMVKSLIDIETSYINTSHPDFKSIISMNQLMEKKKEMRPRSNSFEEPPPPVIETPKTGLFGWFGGGRQTESSSSNQMPSNSPSLADAPNTVMIRAPATEREEMEIEFIRTSLNNYFAIVKKTVSDTVPKAIMHFMVNEVKNIMGARLIAELYKEDKLEELLEEDKGISAKRANCKATLDVMKRALVMINDVMSENFL